MKILHLSATHNWGGGGNHIENLCHELSKMEEDVENVILVARNGQFHKKLENGTIKYFTLPLAFNFDPRAIYKIINICKKEKFDLLHIHGATSISLAVIADHFSELPPFIFSKKTSFQIRQTKGTLYKYNYKKLQKILCVSKATKDITSKNLERPERLKVIYHGTRIDNKSNITPFMLREKLELPEGTIIIGNIANHIEAKNLETFFKTVKYLIKEKKQNTLHFVQIGRFSRETKLLQKQIKKWGLKKNVSMLGFLPDASNYIPQFDVTFLTSKCEGIPQVIYESFYHNIPVVSTSVGGIPEVIEHEKNGLLAPAFDHEKLAENIILLLNNPELKEKFTAISKEKLHRNFTAEKMAIQTLEEYKKVLNGKP